MKSLPMMRIGQNSLPQIPLPPPCRPHFGAQNSAVGRCGVMALKVLIILIFLPKQRSFWGVRPRVVPAVREKPGTARAGATALLGRLCPRFGAVSLLVEIIRAVEFENEVAMDRR